MRAERDIKAANLSHHDLRELIRGPIPAPQPSPEGLKLLDAMAGALVDARTVMDAALHGVGAEIDGQNIPLTDLYPKPQTEAEQLFSLDQPSLRALSHILRHRELWPVGFEWDFSECDACAMGLASELWSLNIVGQCGVPSRRMGEAFGMTARDSGRIFAPSKTYGIGDDPMSTYGVERMKDVTPEMVADKIDEYLAGVK